MYGVKEKETERITRRGSDKGKENLIHQGKKTIRHGLTHTHTHARGNDSAREKEH